MKPIRTFQPTFKISYFQLYLDFKSSSFPSENSHLNLVYVYISPKSLLSALQLILRINLLKPTAYVMYPQI